MYLTNIKNYMNKRITNILIALLSASQISNVIAQEAVTSDLDSCINSEKISLTMKGAAVGALTGLMGSIFSGKKDTAGKNVVIGAVAGGAIGFATAYYKAAGICMDKNPSWVPESKIQRKNNYKEIVKEFKYTSSMGNFIYLRKLQATSSVNPGGNIEVVSKYVVLTPDSGEVTVRIERKLFIIDESKKEEEIPFFGKGIEERVVANGEEIDTVKIPISIDAPKGSSFRIEYRLSFVNDRYVSESIIVKVQ